MKRKLTKVGGSLAVIIPRDVAEAMDVDSKSHVSLTMVGRQLVVEPVDDTVPEATFRRALATVLRRRASTFRDLALFDKT